MPVDYSKWDKLEISDDSDIEVHPNVDKRSMIKWKQEAIHRERAERKAQIAQLQEFIPMEEWIIHQLKPLVTMAPGDALVGVEKLLERATAEGKHIVAVAPSPKPNVKPLLLGEALAAIEEKGRKDMSDNINKEVATLLASALDVLNKSEKELERLKKEDGKKLTSENMFHETANRTILNTSKKTSATGTKKKETVIETLNPNVQMKDLQSAGTSAPKQQEDDEDDGDIELSKEAEEFSKLKGFEPSFKHLLRHPEIINEKMSDQILAEAFTAQLRGEEGYAHNCVVQALTLQYCGQLGRDGVNVFFMRMNGPNQQARKLFFDDVEKTYTRIQSRCAEIAAEQQQGVETIQLQTAQDGSPLTIHIPDEGTEEEAYKVFCALPRAFQDALKTGSLDEINKVLGNTPVEDAETLVQVCSQYGFLDVGEQVIDETVPKQE